MIIITIGEMIVSPVWSTLVAKFAPEDMRGRYMAIGGFSWAVPNMIAPLLAGLILDNSEPHWLWYACLIVGSIAASGYYMLHRQASSRLSLEEQVEMQLAESQA
jgi:MFS family permease